MRGVVIASGSKTFISSCSFGKTRRHLAVDLAEHHRAAIGVDDLARLQPIRAEIHEGADGALERRGRGR